VEQGGSLAGLLAKRSREEDHRDEDISVARVWTGHQAEFWHPGIMAKYIAAGAVAERVRATGGRAEVTWLVVDQDANEPWKVPYPGLVEGKLTRAVWSVPFADKGSASAGAFAAETPACALPVLQPGPAPRGALVCVDEGLEAVRAALVRHAGESNAARQVTMALCDLLAAWCRPDRVVYASGLARTPEFGEFVEQLGREPAVCVQAYNRAVAAVPEARVRALRVEGGRVELPLWRMPSAPGRARRAVWSDELASVKMEELSPRALAMTALVRMGLCDLFIHGTGGGVYDRITERWLGEWLGGEPLAPTAVVTATRYLPFDVRVRRPEEIARARWAAHAARHSPALLGDADGERRRRDLVAAVKSARARGESPRAAYEALHAFLGQEREERAGNLQELERGAVEAARDVEVAGVVYDRTWPFPLYPRGVLDGLKVEVERAVEGADQKKA